MLDSDRFNSYAQPVFSKMQLERPFTRTILFVLAISFASVVMPKLPASVLSLFDNLLVKFLFILLAAYLYNSDPALSFLVAVVLLLAIYLLHSYKLLEGMGNLGPLRRCGCNSQGCKCVMKEDVNDMFEDGPVLNPVMGPVPSGKWGQYETGLPVEKEFDKYVPETSFWNHQFALEEEASQELQAPEEANKSSAEASHASVDSGSPSQQLQEQMPQEPVGVDSM
jgi:hypothetical protein